MFLLLIMQAYAFGITSDYNSQTSLAMSRGESRHFSMELQNMVGGEDLIAVNEILSGKEFVKAVKNEYLVPFGRKDVYAEFDVTIPEDAKPGEYDIGIMFKVSPKTLKEGMVQFNSGSEIRFKLIVNEEIAKKSFLDKLLAYPIILVVIALAVVLMLVFIFIRRK